MRGFSFSWGRALGISAAKGKVSRAIGVPLTKSGRERKIGRMAAGALASLAVEGAGKAAAAHAGGAAETTETAGARGWNPSAISGAAGGLAYCVVAVVAIREGSWAVLVAGLVVAGLVVKFVARMLEGTKSGSDALAMLLAVLSIAGAFYLSSWWVLVLGIVGVPLLLGVAAGAARRAASAPRPRDDRTRGEVGPETGTCRTPGVEHRDAPLDEGGPRPPPTGGAQ